MKPFGEYLTEAKVKAEDYEASIVMAFYEMQGKEIDSKIVKLMILIKQNPQKRQVKI